jgi:hypothetical protein
VRAAPQTVTRTGAARTGRRGDRTPAREPRDAEAR